MLRLKRAYETADTADGYRVLVERLWPRGLRKEAAHFDEWAKNVAPSDELRRWFGHDPDRWSVFRARYLGELREAGSPARAALDGLVSRAKSSDVTLVFSAHDQDHNSAIVLKGEIERRLRR